MHQQKQKFQSSQNQFVLEKVAVAIFPCHYYFPRSRSRRDAHCWYGQGTNFVANKTKILMKKSNEIKTALKLWTKLCWTEKLPTETIKGQLINLAIQYSWSSCLEEKWRYLSKIGRISKVLTLYWILQATH